MFSRSRFATRWTVAAFAVAAATWMPSSATLAETPSTTLYFLRHGETQRRLVSAGTGAFAEVCTATRSCCETPLNPLGIARRDALAAWFVEHGLAKRLTHLIATNKPRTVETLSALAFASGLGGDQNGDGVLDGTDNDLMAGDGIQQYPAQVRECDPGFEATTGSQPFIVAAIQALPPGSRAVIANHSETLYSIITETTGIDTSDPVVFPKEQGSTTRVRNFNDLWIVRMNGSGSGMLVRHVVFEITLKNENE
jgi:broad specificity phosphatase PhoE